MHPSLSEGLTPAPLSARVRESVQHFHQSPNRKTQNKSGNSLFSQPTLFAELGEKMPDFISDLLQLFSAFNVKHTHFVLAFLGLLFPPYIELQSITPIKTMQKPANTTEIFSLLKTMGNSLPYPLL